MTTPKTETEIIEPTIEERLGSIGIDDEVQVTTLAALISELEMQDPTLVIAYIQSISNPDDNPYEQIEPLLGLVKTIAEEQDKLVITQGNTGQEETESTWFRREPKNRLIGILEQLQKIEELAMGLDTTKTMVDVLRDTPIAEDDNKKFPGSYRAYKQITLKNGSTISVTNLEYTLLLQIQEERIAQISNYNIGSISLLLLKGLIVPNTFDENKRIITVREQTQEDFENREMITQSDDLLTRLLIRHGILTVESLLIAFHFSLDGEHTILENIKGVGPKRVREIKAFIEDNPKISAMNTQMLNRSSNAK